MEALARTRDHEDDDFAPRAETAPLIAALDVGVSKTVCLAARRDAVLDMHPDRPLRVLGVGLQSAPAIASGKAADFDACARAIQVSLDEASTMAGAPIRRVVACYSGPGLFARVVRGAVRIKGKTIAGRDIEAALAAALPSTPQQAHLHLEPLRYAIDDGPPLADPCGRVGRRLSVEACLVTAPNDAIQALRACIRQAGAEVEDIIPGPQAAGIAALTADERAEGALVLDLGAGAMGIAAFAAEGLVHAETVPLGGVRMTRDLARRLETTFAAAERVKLAFGALGGACDPKEAVQAPKLGPEGRLEAAVTLRGVIAESLTPRFQEMLLAARERLARAGFAGAAGPQRAVLVGGGASVPGLRELAIETLGMPVRIGRPLDLSGFEHGEAGPAFASAAGLLRWRFDNPTLDDVDQSFEPNLREAADALKDALGRGWGWLRENF